MKKIKKSDWVIIRLLIDGARINSRECFTSPDYVKAVVYLVNKYGLQPTSDAFDVIQKEKGIVTVSIDTSDSFSEAEMDAFVAAAKPTKGKRHDR